MPLFHQARPWLHFKYTEQSKLLFVFIDENVETPLIYSKWFLDPYFQNELFSNKQLNKLTHKFTDVEMNMATF